MGKLTIVVKNLQNSIQGADVQLLKKGWGSTIVGIQTTDKFGQASFNVIKKGTYEVIAEKNGFKKNEILVKIPRKFNDNSNKLERIDLEKR